MPVELRKRKAPAEPAPPPPPPAKKKSNPVKKTVEKAKQAITSKPTATPNGISAKGPPTVGSTITLDGFGGDVKTHDGIATNLAKLVAESKNGVVLFTYPKASTPGCTKQACLFRDEYKPLTSTGFAIYGLSRDSPNANTTFVTKQSLPYSLLCDPAATLIGAIGMKKAPSGTTRGVFVVDKSGKVLAAEPGGPDGTVDVVRRLVGGAGSAPPMEGVTHTGSAGAAVSEKKHAPADAIVEKKPLATTPAESAAKAAAAAAVNGPSVPGHALENPKKDAEVANVAADVADSAQKVDPAVPNPGSAGPSVPHGALADHAKDVAVAKVAAEVADTAQKLDPATPNPS